MLTRFLNLRLMGIASKLITDLQTGGSTPQEFIGDKRLLSLKLMIENSKIYKGSDKSEFIEYVGVMLDNHKAYN
jgi:hypothetical protein